MDIDNQSKNIFDELSKTIDVIGSQRLITVLQNEREGVLKSNDPLVVYIFRIVSDNMGVTIDEIINGRNLSKHRKYSIAYIVYFMYYECDLSLGEMMPILKKSRSLLSRYKTLIECIKEESKPLKWDEKRIFFESAINNFKISQK